MLQIPRLAAGSLLAITIVSSAFAQPAENAPKVLPIAVSSAATRAALDAALVEVTNIGGGSRVDPKLQALVQADPQFVLGRALHAAWLSTLTAAERQRELNAALKLAVDASSPELLFITALREWRAGRPAVARDLTDVVLKQTPDDPFVTWFRILITADPAEALKLTEAAVQRFPNYAPIANFHAYRLQTAGRNDEAIRAVQKYVELAPNHPNAHDSYAEIHQLLGRYDEAAKHYRDALQLDPSYEVAHEGLAEIEFRRGNYAAARAHLAESLKKAGTPARRIVVRRGIANMHLFEGKPELAKPLFRESIAEGIAASIPASIVGDNRMLAALAALEGNEKEAISFHDAAIKAANGVNAPVNDVMVHGLLKHTDAVAAAVTRLEGDVAKAPANAALKQTLHFSKAFLAVLRNDLATARAERQQITVPLWKGFAGAVMAGPLAKAGDTAGAQAARTDVNAYAEMNGNAAVMRLMAK